MQAAVAGGQQHAPAGGRGTAAHRQAPAGAILQLVSIVWVWILSCTLTERADQRPSQASSPADRHGRATQQAGKPGGGQGCGRCCRTLPAQSPTRTLAASSEVCIRSCKHAPLPPSTQPTRTRMHTGTPTNGPRTVLPAKVLRRVVPPDHDWHFCLVHLPVVSQALAQKGRDRIRTAF